MNPVENLVCLIPRPMNRTKNQKTWKTEAEKASWSWVVLAQSNHTLITRWRDPSGCLRSWASRALGRCVENAVECYAIYLQHACVYGKGTWSAWRVGKAQHSTVSHWSMAIGPACQTLCLTSITYYHSTSSTHTCPTNRHNHKLLYGTRHWRTIAANYHCQWQYDHPTDHLNIIIGTTI